MTGILSKNWCFLEAENTYDHQVATAALYAEQARFEALVASFDLDEEALVGPTRRLSRVMLRVENAWLTKILPADFDDFDLSHLGQFPRKSAGNCGAGAIDGTPATGQGQRMARDPS
ncbi:hypothetical protein GR198_05940 [Rhizobium leguminosarum]|uniref:hypothetical protein n=1 Tax=Rhizobium leguminosarum TaxID=384 RepID=UPI0013C0A00F|nr:hypothetical protein [Rhizobium leguminosarum]NEH55287.1 hypothetical protein [Rhizobium leguminosarum]